jgi:flavin-dependent dehydrogenase
MAEPAVEVDVAIVGAGPAGACLALNLAALRRVVVIDRGAGPARRFGESLAPAARRLLGDMGLWDAFAAQGHAPCHGGTTYWGEPAPIDGDGLRDPDGPGWQLDRAMFDGWLRDVARARGAAILRPAKVERVAFEAAGWTLQVRHPDRTVAIRARILVDASGRTAALARRLGARRHVADRLACRWLLGRDRVATRRGLRFVAAEAEGWWYSAALPGDRRILAFHTDADLEAAASVADTAALLRRADSVPPLAELLADVGFAPDPGAPAFCAAHGTTLTPCIGEGWLAVGDAALGFDPLASQGMFQALYSGLDAAMSIDGALSGDVKAFPAYRARLERIAATYRARLKAVYAQEARWTTRPFWERRR